MEIGRSSDDCRPGVGDDSSIEDDSTRDLIGG